MKDFLDWLFGLPRKREPESKCACGEEPVHYRAKNRATGKELLLCKKCGDGLLAAQKTLGKKEAKKW